MLFANTDPRLIAFFMTWLRCFFDIDEGRLRLRLYLHEGLDLDEAVEFWSSITGIPSTQFGKPYRAVANPSLRVTKHPMGCPGVGLSSTAVHRRVMAQIDVLLSSEALADVLEDDGWQALPG